MNRFAIAAIVLTAPAVLHAQVSLDHDYRLMMEWLTKETAAGLAFNTGSTFDPPNELKPGRIQPDISLGIGIMPVDKTKFPNLTVPALARLNPQKDYPDHVTFPNLTLHMRIGLPNRFDATIRGANMTVPKGYQLTPTSTGDGQSNTIGFGIRRHFYGGDMPMLTLGANYNHVFGVFNFANKLKDLELTEGFVLDANNKGQMRWDVKSYGVNAVVSRSYGVWTPFGGLGMNMTSGSVKGRLDSDFMTDLIINPSGQAEEKPEKMQGRFIFGVQMDRSRFGFFLNGEVMAMGDSKGKAFIVSTGIAAPFGLGHSGVVRRGKRNKEALASAAAVEPSGHGDVSDYVPEPKIEASEKSFSMPKGEAMTLRDAPVSGERSRKPKKAEPKAMRGAFPEVIDKMKGRIREPKEPDPFEDIETGPLPSMIFIQ